MIKNLFLQHEIGQKFTLKIIANDNTLNNISQNGKRQEYKIGELLRERYSDFLGDLYRPEYVHGVSSDYDRTKASLQLVLASLYTPAKELVWNEELDWMPIPTHYAPKKLDALFGMWTQCPRYKIEF